MRHLWNTEKRLTTAWYSGSVVKWSRNILSGTMNRLSDVDCYFIPKTERAYSFARTFMIEGVGYDIYPMSWERLEEK